MDRRNFLGTALGSVAGASVFSEFSFFKEAVAASPSKAKNLGPLTISDAAILKQLAVVQQKSSACASAGRSCIQHCQEELIEGHKEFATCAQTSQQMVPLCETVSILAAYKATVIQQVLAACIAACDSCITACKEHEPHFAQGMHQACKACLQSCQECKAECEKLLKMF